MTWLVGSSLPDSPITTQRAYLSWDGPNEAPMMLNSPLFGEVLATPNLAKIKVLDMIAFDGTTCPKAHIMAYINLMLLYTTESKRSMKSPI